jgi:DNA topoisomerase-2
MAAEQYKKHTHREHILELPDTYIGSIDTSEEHVWVFNNETGKMSYDKILFNPGFFKIFDEIIVNARDALVRSKTDKEKQPVKCIDIEVTDEYIKVTNDGNGIPVEEHPEYKVYAPELIFGHLLTSGNYKKEEEKLVGGKNGYGAKLCNIFSSRFLLETCDVSRNLKYKQEWSENMSKCSKPTISKDKLGKGYVKIQYWPEMSRFKDIDLAAMTTILHTRVIELAALAGKDVKVTWNGSTIKSNTFEKFVNLFVRDGVPVAYEQCGDRWEIAAVLAKTLYDDESMAEQHHVSFVNGIHTRKGGKHVETVAKHILGDFCEYAKKKKVDVKPAQIKDSVILFVNSQIVNPSFDSQTKETLTTPATKFGSQFKTKGKIVDGLVRAGLLDEAQMILDAKLAKDAKKTDGKKKTTIRGLPKLEDALKAGSAESHKCTLILTEGDSAATSAITGLKVVGREYWGVFPLRGKLLNVKDISLVKFNQNEELTNIKKILGLEQGKKYSDVKQLRYGRVMIMADQDHDGSHIKGLLMNLFHTEWPALLKTSFLCSLATPLLKASRRSETISFYSNGEFDAWKGSSGKGWTIKYYKGLGTSTPAEAREWFEKMHEIGYEWDAEADENIHLAFNKKRADDRKKWLSSYDPTRVLDLCVSTQKSVKIPYSLFINNELIHFSNADNLRSLPHLMDGLKPSQRKILYGCLKRNLRSEVKVAQLAGYISEHTAYHHGETSLNETIVGMAQTFVGANNINLLVPEGQFGSRLMGGKDSASPRYIHTHLEKIVDGLFPSADSAILKYLDEDGEKIEPETYYPVVPFLLINGSLGIGTGFSTNIPSHNPQDIIALIRDRLNDSRETLEGVVLNPWWLGFRGAVERITDNAWATKGVYEFDDEKMTITVTELPIGVWTKDYKELLDKLSTVDVSEKKEKKKGADGASIASSVKEKKRALLKGFDDLYNDVDVKFVLYFDDDVYHEMRHNPAEFVKKFGLSSPIRTSNMVCFDNSMNIIKYATVGDMMESYYVKRLDIYELRRINEIERMRLRIKELDAKMRFIEGVLDETITIAKASDEDIVGDLKSADIPALDNESSPDEIKSYEYVLKLRIDRLKQSSVDELVKDLEKLQEELEAMEQMSAKELWLEDLSVFEKEWLRMQEERNASLAAGGVKRLKGPKAQKLLNKVVKR